MRHLRDVIEILKGLVVGQQDVRRLELAQEGVVDLDALSPAQPDPDQEEDEGVGHRVRRSLPAAEAEAADKKEDQAEEQRGQQDDQEDQLPQRQLVDEEGRPRRAHQIGHEHRGQHARRDRQDIAAVGQLRAAVIADRAEGDQRHEKQQIEQQHGVALVQLGRQALDLPAPLFKSGADEPEAAQEQKDDARAQADAQVAQRHGHPDRIAQRAGDLDELRGDEHDQHLQRLDQHDADGAERALLLQQALRPCQIVPQLQPDQREHDVAEKYEK